MILADFLLPGGQNDTDPRPDPASLDICYLGIAVGRVLVSYPQHCQLPQVQFLDRARRGRGSNLQIGQISQFSSVIRIMDSP